MNKTISVFLMSSCILLTFVLTSQNSGIKFGIDTDIFKVIERMNLNKFMQNKTLIPAEGVQVHSSSFPSYNIKIANLAFSNVNNPKSVVVNTRSDPNSETKYLEIKLISMQFDLTTDFDIEVISLFKDSGRKTQIKVVLDSIDGEIYFNSGNVHFTKFQVHIGDIDIKFNSFWYKTIYYIGKSLIIKGINSKVSSLHDVLEKALNQFITSEWLIDIGMGIGFNATNVDRPQLDFFERNRINQSSKVEKIEAANLNFLKNSQSVSTGFVDDDKYNTILKFGVHGSLYPNLSPELRPEIAPAGLMVYPEYLFNNEISILISDYTLNTLLFMVQQTGALKKVLTNSTNDVMPINIDTQGMSGLIPELAQKYTEDKEMEFKMYVNPFGYSQPEIDSDLDGAKLSLNFGLEFNVFESDDPFDDAVTQLKTDVKAHLKFQFMISDNKLSVILFKIYIDQIVVKTDELNINIENFKVNLEKVLNDLMEKYKPMIQNFDVAGIIKSNFSLETNNLIVNTNNNFIVVSIDVEDLK
jgi:hypothetical protein